MSPKKATTNSKSAEKTPTKARQSAFSKGAYKATPPGMSGKDNRNVMMYEGLQQGIMIAYAKKANKNEGAFIGPSVSLIENTPEVMDELWINAIVPRKGDDGTTPLKNTPSVPFNWKQFVMIIGEDNNSLAGRKAAIKKLVNQINSNVHDAGMYQYPTEMKIGQDLTQEPLRAADVHLLDNDVIALMMAAYPTLSLEELTEDEVIMATFWTDVSRGVKAIEGNEW